MLSLIESILNCLAFVRRHHFLLIGFAILIVSVASIAYVFQIKLLGFEPKGAIDIAVMQTVIKGSVLS